MEGIILAVLAEEYSTTIDRVRQDIETDETARETFHAFLEAMSPLGY